MSPAGARLIRRKSLTTSDVGAVHTVIVAVARRHSVEGTRLEGARVGRLESTVRNRTQALIALAPVGAALVDPAAGLAPAAAEAVAADRLPAAMENLDARLRDRRARLLTLAAQVAGIRRSSCSMRRKSGVRRVDDRRPKSRGRLPPTSERSSRLRLHWGRVAKRKTLPRTSN